ncbi:MAG: hypothetical protein EZS28_031238 [Streblomastix strix]|uniref:Uncharacterized protein n=1 Tax=Streblomastix strix TaxID=222440 RepID=A0A5J4UU35_9EUKA|nr:MAG: hypothetical protein EZS28_031238 [Streblomastix strix]
MYMTVRDSESMINITGQLEFENCSARSGGGMYIQNTLGQTIGINKASFKDCYCEYQGGGLGMDVNGNFTVYGTLLFQNCSSAFSGGGIYITIDYNGIVNFNPTQQILIENCNCSYYGGGLCCNMQNQGYMIMNNMKFRQCTTKKYEDGYYSERPSGGGLFANINSGSQLILNNSCEFYQCESYGNGGGICVIINYYETQSSFIILDALIHECKAHVSEDSSIQRYSHSGFGGGIFLGGAGKSLYVNSDYDPSTELIDLHGMKIDRNTAEIGGQSLFVAMSTLVEWCKYGILGFYVKGNFSDAYSDENELEGIPVDYNTYYYYYREDLDGYYKPLKRWWAFGILKRAQVVVNVSNPIGKLIFYIEGQNMAPGHLNVKIFVLRDKIQENINQEQGEINKNKKNINHRSFKQNSLQPPIAQKHYTDNQQQISISSNLKLEKKLQNDANELIYPLEDGSSAPISIEGETNQNQIAAFVMNYINWLNYKEKVYGILISNDRIIFTGVDGHDIKDDANAAIQLEVKIEQEDEKQEEEYQQEQLEDEDEEEEVKGKGLPVIAIIGIAFGVFAFIDLIVIIIIIIVVVVSVKKKEKAKKQHNNEQQLTELSAIVEPPQSSTYNNANTQVQLSNNANSQIKSCDITNLQVRSYDSTNASDQPSNISNPKVQQTFITKSLVHPSNITNSEAQSSIKPISKAQSYYIPNYRAKKPSNLVKQQSISQSRLPPLNQQQQLVRTPPLNQQQYLVRTPPLNDNIVLHQKSNENLQTNNPVNSREVVNGKK